AGGHGRRSPRTGVVLPAPGATAGCACVRRRRPCGEREAALADPDPGCGPGSTSPAQSSVSGVWSAQGWDRCRMPGRPRTLVKVDTTKTAAISSHRTVRGWKIRCRITGIGVVVSQFSEAFATDTTLVPEREVSMAAGPRPAIVLRESVVVPGWSITVMPWFVTRETEFPEISPAEPRE